MPSPTGAVQVTQQGDLGTVVDDFALQVQDEHHHGKFRPLGGFCPTDGEVLEGPAVHALDHRIDADAPPATPEASPTSTDAISR